MSLYERASTSTAFAAAAGSLSRQRSWWGLLPAGNGNKKRTLSVKASKRILSSGFL
jgi:hypothetical protein